MDREKVLKFLESQLKKLKEEHVEDLMKHGRIDELEQVAEELDFSTLDEYCGKADLELEMDEIPLEGYEYEMCFYAMYSQWNDDEIFANYIDFIELLESKNEKMATEIANFMQSDDLMELSIEQLIK